MATADENLWIPESRTWHRQFADRQRLRATEPLHLPPNFAHTVTDRIILQEKHKAITAALVGGLQTLCPMTFTRAPDGTVHMASGLGPVLKWDGVAGQTDTSGVTAPATALTIAGSGTGSITGTYTAYQRFLDKDGRPSSLSPISNTLVLTSRGQIDYSSVPLPTQAKVTRRQILRNTAGQTLTYYVDVDSTDLTVTTFTSTRTDATLAVQTAVPIFDSEGASLASRYGVARDDKPIIIAYLDRLFLAGEIAYSEGHVEVTYGSTSVTGIGTNWPSVLANRYFYAVGHDEAYLISSVNIDTQVLTLSTAYRGSTDRFGVYTIRPAAAERRNLYHSQAGSYEAWSPTDGLTLEETGDEITGLMVADSFLFILCRRHIYRLTYHLGPQTDGGIFLSAHRGCVNHRCWVYLDGYAFMLDEHGIYKFRGSGDAEQLSGPVQDLWWNDASTATANDLRINWSAQKWFHASHSRDEATIRWFVALSGSRLPRHAICFNYVTESWWVEEYPFPIGASCILESDSPKPLYAGPARRVFAPQGTLDGPDPKAGTTRGTVTSATILALTDTAAVFPTSGVVGSPVAIIDGRGKGQLNLVTAQSGTELTVQRPWRILPDTTSVYQVGAIPWQWRGHWMRWLNEEGNQTRRAEILFKPLANAHKLDMRFYENHAETPTNFGTDWPVTSAEGDGVTTAKDDPDAEIDLNQSTGYAQVRLDGRRERHVRKSDVVSVELKGHSGRDPIAVYEMIVEGAE